MRVWRIACAVVVTLVKGKKPGVLAFEMSAEAHLMVIHGTMGNAAAELEQQLLLVAVVLVLLNSIKHGLLGELVLKFKGGDRQAIDKHDYVESACGINAAVAELARHAEDIGRELFGSLYIARGWSTVEEIQTVWAVLDTAAQYIHHARRAWQSRLVDGARTERV
jgi:hypothetical protein